MSFSLGVSIAPMGLDPANKDLVESTFLFEDEIIVECWDVLVVVLTLFRNLLCCVGVLQRVRLGAEKTGMGRDDLNFDM